MKTGFTIDEFHEVFHDLPSTRLSKFNCDTEKFVSDGLQECSEMNTKHMSAALSILEL
jgi:hypothetical protein